ncbi:HDIG domain-containing protein [Bremerella cremea]|uniref:HDIG domain-containing protein n=1 Tax=Bremerella cremea TaxID=1031537 RepID=A0A368KSG5_9BACT|nr:HDIG domain-containing metalloprotein [Bremerella cremea]RCS51901.1 HDIG domain-containing protein [Bremerella cremea]
MAPPGKTRKRGKRIQALELPPGTFRRFVSELSHPDKLLYLACALFAAVALWLVTGAWNPPMQYRLGYVPPAEIHPRVQFSVDDDLATTTAERDAENAAMSVYNNDPARLEQMRTRLQTIINQLTQAKQFDAEVERLWNEFFPIADENVAPLNPKEREEQFIRLKTLFQREGMLNAFQQRVETAFKPFASRGIMAPDQLELKQGQAASIIVVTPGPNSNQQIISLNDVLRAQVLEKIRKSLQLELEELAKGEDIKFLVEAVDFWVEKNLPGTLTFDRAATTLEREKAVKAVEKLQHIYSTKDAVVPAGIPLNGAELALLRSEHQAYCDQRSFLSKTIYSLAILGMYYALGALCAIYLVVKCPRILKDLNEFLLFLAPTCATIALGYWFDDRWQAEVLVVMILAMTISIVYQQEFALLVTACVSLAIVLTSGSSLVSFVTVAATCSAATLSMTRIRSRNKLLFVGLWAGVVAFATNYGVSIVAGQPATLALLEAAARQGAYAVGAGILMTVLLPFVEKAYGILTDISLLELGDAAHPLLQKLAQRAPGTYNHSITVASIAEAAADSIRANGLLVRVGAYFHDIGKMLKPEYFVENQNASNNRHDGLNPAISTLVIIAHVKDGADLARQNRLPRAIIDFIEQHHGTTLVEYFYRVASAKVEANPDEREVDEAIYRYPGPKPQTKEAAVLMICDAVESACRTLVEPTSARIEALVEELSMKRLLDGQFDECGLTLQELRQIQNSVTKSLTAVYHGRVKYPSSQPA